MNIIESSPPFAVEAIVGYIAPHHRRHRARATRHRCNLIVELYDYYGTSGTAWANSAVPQRANRR